MIIEYIRYGLSDEAQAKAFESDYHEAASILEASAYCHGYELTRCVDSPLQYILRIEWDSAEGHLLGFRSGSSFSSFFKLVKPFVAQVLEMRHYELTSVVSPPQAREAS